MAKLDQGELIQKTHDLVTDSKELHERSRRAIKESKRLQGRLGLPRPKRLDPTSRKRLLAK